MNGDNLVVYYRTILGPAEKIKTMAVDAQYDQRWPEIAVLDNGTAVLVWIEYMKTSTQYRACYTMIPLTGYYINTCVQLDEGHTGSGLVRVVARGDDAYIIYDRVEGDWIRLFYKQVAGGSASGEVWSPTWSGNSIAHTNMAIDSVGNLHVVWYLYRPSIEDFLFYSSNAAVDAEGNMDQNWSLIYGDYLTSSTYPVGISFYNDGTGEKVVMAFVYYDGGIDGDEILVVECPAVGCSESSAGQLYLPAGHSWSISQVNLVGAGDQYHISFIDYNTVWLYTGPDGGWPTEKTSTSDSKTRLRMVFGANLLVLGYMQTTTGAGSGVYVNIPVLGNILVFHPNECTTYGLTDMASNNSDVAGVWSYCGQTWFSTNAYKSSLPLILKLSAPEYTYKKGEMSMPGIKEARHVI